MGGFRIGRKHAQHTYPEGNPISGLLGNRVQQAAPNGAVVAAGNAITPDASITIRSTGGTGRIRVTATGSYSFDTGGAGVHVFLTIQKNAGPVIKQWVWAHETDGVGTPACVFELDAPAVKGDVIHVHWQTTAGDVVATLGDTGVAGGILGAVLLLEELPPST